MAIVTVAWSAQTAFAQAGRSIPTQTYFGNFTLLHAGEYREALKGFGSERGIRTPQSRWIDSICYHTMTGECYYKLGQYGEAIESYTAALNLYVAFSNWMGSVQFTAVVAPVTNRPALPWGGSTRNMKLGNFPDFPILQGQPVTEAAVRRGGVISPPVQRLINVHEIVRCTCLAMMRRAELLGSLSKHDRLTDKVLTAAAQRIGVPNHWSQAWLDAQLGFANAAAGNEGQAFALLQRSLTAGGEMDHPITGLALLQLGKLSLDAGKLAEAARLFEEATYTAAEHNDLTVLEEAFRYASIVHTISRPKTVFAPLAPATTWGAKRGGRELQASLLIQAAESAAGIGQTQAAMQLLTQARTLIGRRVMAACEIGARLNYITAMAQYQAGNVAQGDESLAAALKIYKGFSPWLFQLALTSTELAKNNLSSRDARTIFERLGDDPRPADWVARPMDCLAVLSTPHHATYEQWLETVSERDLETRLEVTERARRHRFYTALPFGGRLLALRWLLEAPEETLDNEARLQRQDLQARYPTYTELSKRAETLRTQLKLLPLVPDPNSEDLRKQSELFAELATTTTTQEKILREIAVRREPANFAYPPIRKMKDVQADLPSGTVLLSVFAANRQMHAILLSKDKYANWKVERPEVLEKRIAALLRAMGNQDRVRELPQSQLADKSWQEPAREVIDHFLKGSGLNFAQKFDELVVVPDGALWYLPFEAVHVGEAKDTMPLIAKTRVRYAPTVGLAFSQRRGRLESPEVAVVLPKSDANDEPGGFETFVTKLQAGVPKATVLQNGLAAPSPLYGACLDGLVVLDDLANNPQSPFDWSPLPLDRQESAGSLANWMTLPWKTTDVMVLPGFHTPSESALRDGAAARGHDLFLASCGLMATGARTVVLSRWRTGGQSSRELVRQFVQELPFSTASQAWQRAVQLVKESPLDVAYEPRVRSAAGAPPINGEHPFFWAGYMVFDSGVLPHSQVPEPEEPPVLKIEPPKEEQIVPDGKDNEP